MDWVEKMLAPMTGAWTPLIIVILIVLVWAIKNLPGWLSTLTGSVHGSPSSPRYWRARLAEALNQLKDAPEVPERMQLSDRATEARIMVEAHEARRRVGVGGGTPYWVSTIFCAVAASVTWTAASANESTAARVVAGILVVLMIAFEGVALYASSVRTERFNVLVAAGRLGHSDLVRTDPWTVLRKYDIWVTATGPKAARKVRNLGYKQSISRGIRHQRSWFGPVYESGEFGINEDIWAATESGRGDVEEPVVEDGED